ncbi:anthranilate synthase component 1 [Aeromonas rivipollensis]|uniref:anthranilate synthase component 1 n=1 Tax=Aeromonas rivipollensis TaxID=948519 RepID=UPI00259DA9EA|nr:anthranilate synthase component 1 [Aeromonas rivipollensis]MDM5084234.1 anthranilate synthase component 1 [Aeromonas rivipollensis]MDM5096305.1 anthranilate synthase component 1 [Aeromonas rivipollensis]MDM5105468.1 anthranilate synthase component 1 [Aeromonas rivipollensis]
MTGNKTRLPLGEFDTIRLNAPYVTDPLALYTQLCQHNPNNLLLESVEIDSKAGTQSLLLVDACLRIECRGRTVRVRPLTRNGVQLQRLLEQRLSTVITQTRVADELQLDFPASDRTLDEDSRLKGSSVLDVLRTLQQELQCQQGKEALFMGGSFAYDLIASFEDLPEVPEGSNDCPDYCFYVAETLITIDHIKQSTALLACLFGGEQDESQLDERYAQLTARLEAFKQACQQPQPVAQGAKPLTGNLHIDKSDKQFCAEVEKLKGFIRRGDIFQVVPSRSFSLPCPDPLAAYRRLKQTNPSPYMFYVQDEGFTLFGASPESAVKFCAASRQVEMYPIAGTRRRGLNPDGSINLDLDGRIELELRQDEKEVAEHLMLVDLGRNDIARISEPGTRYVKDLLKVDRYSHVMHLVSRVVGRLRSDLDALHAYQACMNMGTLTGAPKLRASELIRMVEGKRRGSYGGAVGYLNGAGEMDTCIVIRSAFVKAGLAHVQAGAGVVYDSKPQAEADETRAKAAAVLAAIAASHGTSLQALSAQQEQHKDVSHD